ncbi:MAG: HisA/HisF-related TIM barrel protein [Gammaproteobacteria bacterium]
MQIIPVIDLKDGRVVHAKCGFRDRYRPLNTPLCPSSNPFDAIEAFLSLHSFGFFYIADLNAITGTGDHSELIQEISIKYPQITFWTDAGYRRDLADAALPDNRIPVLGSESLNPADLEALQVYRNRRYILSLDFSAGLPLGPPALFDNPSCWPENVLLMPLDKVGSGAGPDFLQLARYRRLYPEKNFIASGGSRHLDDLLELQKMGIKQALVASALHEKKITPEQIRFLHRQ